MAACRIQNCDQTCKPGSRFDICARCRAAICLWLKRHPSAVKKRQEDLDRYQDRFTQVPTYKKERDK